MIKKVKEKHSSGKGLELYDERKRFRKNYEI